MSIVPLKKITLCGLIDEKSKILESLQVLGCLHLVSLRAKPSEREKLAPVRPEEAYKALRYLLDCPNKRRQVRENKIFYVNKVVHRVLSNQQHTRDASDRRDFLKQRIKEVEPWGDFKLPPLETLAGVRLWFYIIPCSNLKDLQSMELAWQIVHRDQQQAYVIVMSREEPDADAMPVPRVHMGALSLCELHLQLEQAELELEDLTAKRESLTRWIFLLTQNLATAENHAALAHAGEQTLDKDSLFAVQGWIPVRDMDHLKNFVDTHRLAMLAEEPLSSDSPPTLLENPKQLGGGEDVVGFYQMPGYRDWDPSFVVFFSFALFFGMILSDAGYALLLWLVILFYWKRMGTSIKGRRFRTLASVVATVSVLYGIMVGGYFGKTPPEDSLLAALKILDINNFEGMMSLSVVIGAMHVALANGFMAWQLRKSSKAMVPIGWIVVQVGGLPLILRLLGVAIPTFFSTLVPWLLGLGGLTILFFSSERSLKGPMDLLIRLLEGVKGLTNLSKLFGDILSYLRLFALGLASGSLALTFNQLAGNVAEAVPGIGLLLGILILVLGHLLNFILSLMSGVVHGLRLNFIEFYNWGVSEEGYPFRAFSKKEIES